MKKKTLKKLLLAFIMLAVILGAGSIYLNKFFLPTKIKSLIIQTLEKETGKKANLESVRFNIFKGLVLKNLVIYDETKSIISLKEGSCTFLLLPILKERKVIIPNIKLDSPVIFLERRKDNTVNLVDLLPKKPTRKLNLLVLKINVTNGRVDFQDSSLSPVFSKSLENLSLSLGLSLPASIKFNLKSDIPAKPQAIALNIEGNYKLPEKALSCLIKIDNLGPIEFSAYYQVLAGAVKDGMLNSLVRLDFKDGLLTAELESQITNLILSKDKILGKLDSGLKASAQYGLEDKKISYGGILDVTRLDVSGIEQIDKIENIRGKINFNQDGLNSERLELNILGLPFQTKLNLANFSSPLVNLSLTTDLDLGSTQKILNDKLKTPSLPVDLQGKGKLSLDVEAKIPIAARPIVNGSLDILSAQAKFDKIKDPVTNINGRVDFNLDSLHWEKLNLDYSGNTYLSSGTLKNFKAPNINFDLATKDLAVESELNIKEKQIYISRLKGRYLNSDFAAEGSVDASNPDLTPIKISAGINLDLKDLGEPLKKFKDTLEKIKPNGILNMELNVEGNIRDFKNCAVKAKFSSPSLSLYGLKTSGFFLNYNQSEGLGDISIMNLSLYDGLLAGSAKINLTAENLPYLISASVNGLNIEKLKADTPLKDKDIAGTIQAQLKLNGFSDDLSKLSGAGKVAVTKGKLWQLNLLKGLGELLFTKDFADIVFDEGYCEFFVKDKYIFTDNLKLNSNLVSLAGSGKIGFDSSLEASINVQMSDEMTPQSTTIKDFTTALIGQAGRFAVIKLSGTLRDPKYKVQPAVADVIKSLIGSVFGK